MSMLAMGCQTADEDDPSELAQSATAEPGIDAGSAAPDAADAGSERDARTLQPDAGPAVLRPLNAPYSVEIKANGMGCPASSWEATLAPDGETFEVAFAQYTAAVVDGQRSAFRDCNLTVRFRGSSSFSYAVSSFEYQGYALLEPNVRGFVTMNQYSRGNPVPSVDRDYRTDLTGPVDRSFSFVRTMGPTDIVWAPCGLDRNLNIPTRIAVQKSQNQGAGSITLSGIRFKLASRTCT